MNLCHLPRCSAELSIMNLGVFRVSTRRATRPLQRAICIFQSGPPKTTDGPTAQQLSKLLVSSDPCSSGKTGKERNPRKTPGESAMATSAVLRRAPRAAAAARSLLGAMSGSRVPPPRRLPYRAERSALLSSLSAPQPGAAADAHLLRVINYEISCAQQDCKKRDWVCDPAIS